MSRRSTRSLMARAHGRTSLYVRRDIGAVVPSRWQDTQLFWKIGATSFVNVCAPSDVTNPQADTSMIVRTACFFMFAIMCSPLLAFSDFDRGLHVRPAAVVAEVSGSLSGTVVDNALNDVFTRFAESCDCRDLAFNECGFRGVKGHCSRPAVLGPDDRHANGVSGTLWQSIVFCG